MTDVEAILAKIPKTAFINGEWIDAPLTLDVINPATGEAFVQVADASPPVQSLARIAAVEQCRERLRSNAAPLLAVEALMVSLRPQA